MKVMPNGQVIIVDYNDQIIFWAEVKETERQTKYILDKKNKIKKELG